VQLVVDALRIDRERQRVPREHAGAHRDHERVERQRVARAGVRHAAGGVDPGQPVDDELGAQVVRHLAEVVAIRGAEGERLPDCLWAVHELRLGREERHGHALAASSRRARTVSRPATPPPATTTR
jgi:hypothetical protein